jgi:hypothetical protein
VVVGDLVSALVESWDHGRSPTMLPSVAPALQQNHDETDCSKRRIGFVTGPMDDVEEPQRGG